MIKFNLIATIFLALFILLSNSVLAASDVFEVETQIIGNPPDVTPPTTPSITSAVPVAVSQIDIEWSASTDNVFVNTYELFRDGVNIATTTLTSYSDTGLNSSTTYTYTVRSIDTSKNYSSTSAPVSATTLEIYVPPETPPIEGTVTSVKFKDFNIEPGQNSAKFYWEANTYAQYTFRWGRTSSYELGFVTTDIFKKTHQTVIKDLEPATSYDYEIWGYNRRGKEFLLARDSFTTIAPDDIFPPTNVTKLRAEVVGEDVRLYWQNPEDEDFASVRILRSHRFFANDPYAGFLVYQGDEETVTDENAFALGDDQYYTVFSYDELGNVSSGAVLWVNRERGVTDLRTISFELDNNESVIGGAGDDPTEAEKGDGVLLEEELLLLSISDIEIIQDGRVITANTNDRFAIAGGENFTVRIPYERLPEHLKTITVTLSHPVRDNQVFSFLLRVNKDKTAYEATVAALEFGGEFGLTIDVFDFKTESLRRVTGSLNSSYTTINSTLPVVEEMFKSPRTIITITIGAFIFVLIVLWLVTFGRRSD